VKRVLFQPFDLGKWFVIGFAAWLAHLGDAVNVPTPWGDERVLIPAGVQSGTALRLKGKGLPRLGRAGNGDIHVRVHLWTPEHLSDEQKRLFQEKDQAMEELEKRLRLKGKRELVATAAWRMM
jgi:molecular chaperone DnaJ